MNYRHTQHKLLSYHALDSPLCNHGRGLRLQVRDGAMLRELPDPTGRLDAAPKHIDPQERLAQEQVYLMQEQGDLVQGRSEQGDLVQGDSVRQESGLGRISVGVAPVDMRW